MTSDFSSEEEKEEVPEASEAEEGACFFFLKSFWTS
jgi:hypothetical protein